MIGIPNTVTVSAVPSAASELTPTVPDDGTEADPPDRVAPLGVKDAPVTASVTALPVAGS